MTKHKREQPGIDTASVLDTAGLTDQYRQAVAAALPAAVSPSDEFWRDLEYAIALFFALQQHRIRRPAQLERWQNIDRLVSELADELRVTRGSGWSGFDFDRPADKALLALWRIKRMADAAILGFQEVGANFRGNSDLYRRILYGDVLDLWCRHLGQELNFSRSDRGVPCGPLIRFLSACLSPVLGAATPKASGFASIIYRERKLARVFAGVGTAGGTGTATGRAISVSSTKK